MLNRQIKVGIFLIFAVLIGFTTIKVANAWVVQNPKWDLSSSNYVYFRANELPSTWQSRLYMARDSWNNVSGSSITLLRNDQSYGIRVYDGHVDGQYGWAGVTRRYWSWNTYISWATIELDEDENWYTSSSTCCIASDQVDLVSNMTHELGHSVAIKHTNASCSGSSRPTMCDGIVLGTTYKRSLESDDEGALGYLYP